jgi:hypothetical protein
MRIRPRRFGFQGREGRETKAAHSTGILSGRVGLHGGSRHPWHSKPQRPCRPGRRGRLAPSRPTHIVATAWGVLAPDDPAGGRPLARSVPGSETAIGTVRRGCGWCRSCMRPAMSNRIRSLRVTRVPAPPWCGRDRAACETGDAASGSARSGKSDGRADHSRRRSCDQAFRVPLTVRSEWATCRLRDISLPRAAVNTFLLEKIIPVVNSIRPNKLGPAPGSFQRILIFAN